MWVESKVSPSDLVRTKPTGNLKVVIEEALPSINKIFDYDEYRHFYSSRQFSTKAPDNLYHVSNCNSGDNRYDERIQKPFDVEIGRIMENVDGTGHVEIWIFGNGDVAYAMRVEDIYEHYDDYCRLLRSEDYHRIYYAHGITQEDEIAKLKNADITPEDVGITAEVLRQKILDKVVEMQMRKKGLQGRASSKGYYIATAVYGSYDCPEA